MSMNCYNVSIKGSRRERRIGRGAQGAVAFPTGFVAPDVANCGPERPQGGWKGKERMKKELQTATTTPDRPPALGPEAQTELAAREARTQRRSGTAATAHPLIFPLPAPHRASLLWRPSTPQFDHDQAAHRKTHSYTRVDRVHYKRA